MQDDRGACTGGASSQATAWECFYRVVLQSLLASPVLQPMPAHEDSGDATVRAMQRARRHTWLHARHGLHWSMFESVRISVRLAEVFADWTRDGAPDLDVLAERLEQVEQEAREPASVTAELRFVDRLMDTSTDTDLRLVEMELAMEAYRRLPAPDRRSAASG